MNKNIIGLIIVIIAFLTNFIVPLMYKKHRDENDSNSLRIKAISLFIAVIGMIIVFI